MDADSTREVCQSTCKHERPPITSSANHDAAKIYKEREKLFVPMGHLDIVQGGSSAPGPKKEIVKKLKLYAG